jgi:2-oxoglutarate dehydrogenase E2 component (dihydrolipoamide succinyltransferase)
VKATVSTNTRLIRGDDNRSVYVGDIVEGADAGELVELGYADEIVETATPSAQAVTEAPPDVFATQAALDHAAALGVDLAGIQGTGKDGKVTKGDVEAAVAAKEEA